MLHDELLHKWINNTISEDELKIFKERPEYDSLVELYKQTEGLTTGGFNEDKVLKNILTSEKRSAPPKRSAAVLPLWVKLAVAASFFLAAVLFFLPSNDLVSYSTGVGETLVVDLPDNSSVKLSSGSQLSFSKGAWETSRSINFEGDAFFEVTKGKQFVVKTDLGEVEVLGTSFNVNTLNQVFTVLCKSGKVAVSNSDATIEEVIVAGEGLTITDNQISLSSKNDMVRFKNLPFYEVLDLFQKHYKKRVEPKGIDLQTKVNGFFVKDNLEEAIQSIALPMQLKFQIEADSTITLNK